MAIYVNPASVRIDLSDIDELQSYEERRGDFAAASVLFAIKQAPDSPQEYDRAKSVYLIAVEKEVENERA